MCKDGLLDEVVGHQLSAVDEGVPGEVGQGACREERARVIGQRGN